MAFLRRSSHASIGIALLFAITAAATGCGQDDDANGDGVAVVDGSGSSTSSGGDDGGTGDDSDGGSGDDDDGTGDGSDGSTTSSSTSAGDPGDDDPSLPGDPFDIGPPAGSALDVVGVRYDDVLNFRERPDPSAPIVDTAAPESSTPEVVSEGGGRLLSRSAWWKVTVDGEEAWANFRFLGMLGATDDIIDELIADLPSTTAPTVDALVDDIAESRGSGPVPTVELVTPVEGLDAGGAQVTIDVLGIGDDALKGERILLTFDLVFDDPDASDREVEAYEVVGALRTIICGRGISGEACV
jgi:hypothetical protein